MVLRTVLGNAESDHPILPLSAATSTNKRPLQPRKVSTRRTEVPSISRPIPLFALASRAQDTPGILRTTLVAEPFINCAPASGVERILVTSPDKTFQMSSNLFTEPPFMYSPVRLP